MVLEQLLRPFASDTFRIFIQFDLNLRWDLFLASSISELLFSNWILRIWFWLMYLFELHLEFQLWPGALIAILILLAPGSRQPLAARSS